MDKIEPGQVLSDEQQRAVWAALAMRGLDLKGFAAEHALSYGRLQRMTRGHEVVTPDYAAKLASLVRLHLVKPVRSPRFAHAA